MEPWETLQDEIDQTAAAVGSPNLQFQSLSQHRFRLTMVASAVFITDLQGKAIISRNYRGDVPLNKAIEQFAKYLDEVEEEAKKPIFHIDSSGDIILGDDVGSTGPGGEHFVYIAVSTFELEGCSRSIKILCSV